MSVLLINGNSLSIPLADNSVHCVVTSPPYWSLRDYGIDGQLGLERTPEEYVANMVAVFREVKRVLRDDGTCWVNLGDSYAGSPAGNKGERRIGDGGQIFENKPFDSSKGTGLKQKDLCGIPWRVAFALQADGWWLRSDIIWSKPNPMPESVTDRPTKSHEYLFLLAKSQRYYYDADSIREPIKPESLERERYGWNAAFLGRHQGSPTEKRPFSDDHDGFTNPSGRNRRTVWEIATAPYSGAHFATYPPALVEPCVRAGTSERGVCPECGKPWERVTEKGEYERHDSEYQTIASGRGNGGDRSKHSPPREVKEIGWQPTCTHDADPVPAVVFDPFAGSGTTLVVARSLGRYGVGLDLSLRYLIENARTRLDLDKLDAWMGGKKDGKLISDLPLFRR